LLFLYSDDKVIESTVVSEKKVDYNGNEYSLTRLTRELLNIEHDVQPTRYWSYLGKVLTEYYDSTYAYDAQSF
jgi:hypothetical protein